MRPTESPYNQGLDQNTANHVALSPLSFIERAAHVYPDRVAILYGERRQTWRDTYTRSRQLAGALAARGVGKNDTVAVMLPNVPAMFEAHFGVPMAGAVLNTLNTRLDPEAIAFMLEHGEAKVLLTDREFASVIAKALDLLQGPAPTWWRWKTTLRPQALTWATPATRPSWPPATRSTPGRCPRTSGTPSR